MQHAPNAACPKCSMPQMQHAPNAACPKCSMPQMQHAPFRHVRVAYPRIISAPVSARAKYTNSSGNNQTMSRGEKEVSGGVAGVQIAADIHRECTPSCVRERTLPCAPLPTEVGAPSSAQSGGSPSPAPVGATGRSPLHIYASASFYLLPAKVGAPNGLRLWSARLSVPFSFLA